MGKRSRSSLAPLTAAGALALAGTAAPAPAAEVSLRYSALVLIEEPAAAHGWQGSLAADAHGPLSLVLDVGGHYVPSEGDAVHVVLAGPRLSARSGRGAVFAQLLIGVAIGSSEHGGAEAIVVAQPGLGVDFAARRGVGLRLQAEWPVITQWGVYAGAPRLSGGVVLAPGRSGR